MKCPFCRETGSEVYNTRATRFATQTWRRRRCLSCGQSFTTYEQPDLRFLAVLKRHRKAEHYSRAKLFSSIYAAFQGLPAKPATIDGVTDTVEAKILDSRSAEMPSAVIAHIVLATLKRFDTAAFVRYLSLQTHLANDAQLRRELKKY